MGSTGITITINAATADAAAQMQQFFSGVTGGLDKLTGASDFLEGLGAKIAAAFTLGGIVEEFNKAVNSADEFGKAVQKTGLSFPTLNALKVLAEENGISFADLTMALQVFNNRIFEAIKLGGDAARPFNELKISLTDSKGAFKGVESAWRQFMDRMKEMPDGIQKTGYAMELLPRIGREMIPFLNEGSALLDHMKVSGGGITPEMAANAREFKVAVAELDEQLQNVARRLMVDVLPALKAFVAYLKDGVLAMELGRFSEFFELSMKSAIQDVSNFFAQEIAKWGKQVEQVMDKAHHPGFWSKAGNAAAGVGTGLLAVGDEVGGELGVPGAQEMADKRVEQANAFFEKAGIADGIMNRAAQAWVDGTKGLPNLYKAALEKLREELNQVNGAFDKMTGGANSPGRSSFFRKSGTPASAGDAGGTGDAAVSEQGKNLIKDIDKAWREATQGKLALLDHDKEETLKRLKDEFDSASKNEKVYNEQRLKAEQTYAAQRQAILDEQQDHENARALDAIKDQIDTVQKDPDLTEIEKKKKLIALLEEERTQLQKILDLQNQRAKDPKLNEEARGKAQDDAAKTQSQLTNVNTDIAKQSQSPFAQMKKELEDQNNLQLEVANSFKTVFNGAIESVSSNLTAVIMKTETWRQALAKVGQQILSSVVNSIIEMGVRYILTTIEMAIFGKTVAASTTAAMQPIADTLSATWAVPATLATIASYGGAADAAGGEILGAIAETLGTVTAFATGGLVTGPGTETSDSVLARLSRGEYVIPADRVKQIGVERLDYIRNGGDLYHGVMASMARPITSNPDYQQAQADKSENGGAGNGGVTVQGHQLSVNLIQPKNRQEMLDALRSNEGQNIVINHVKTNKTKIGIGT